MDSAAVWGVGTLGVHAPSPPPLLQATHKFPGPSGMGYVEFKGWLAAATREERIDRSHRDVLVNLVVYIWPTGELPTGLSWAILMVLPKPEDGGTRGIGLLEALWKLVATIIDGRLKTLIAFHDARLPASPGHGRYGHH